MLGLSLTGIARQLEASLEGVTGGSLLEGTEQMPIRVCLDDDIRGDLSAIADLPIQLPGAANVSSQSILSAVPLSELATLRLEPAESVINRRNGERTNTVQGFIVPTVLPEKVLKAVQAALETQDFTLPAGYRLELGGDSDARSSTGNNLVASVGLIVTLTIATIALTFNSFRLTAVALVVTVLSAGLSMLALAVFNYPFGINAIIGVIESIGVPINAAVIILTGLQSDPQAASGDRCAMAQVVTGSSRHTISTAITTFSWFLPLILAGGGFWPPFAVSIARGLALHGCVFLLYPADVCFGSRPYPPCPRRRFSSRTTSPRSPRHWPRNRRRPSREHVPPHVPGNFVRRISSPIRFYVYLLVILRAETKLCLLSHCTAIIKVASDY